MAWVFAIGALVYLMILVGGATRLTDSGLSIVEWAPVTGAIPPLSESQWLAELEKYRSTTEYQAQNRGMSLQEFKVIYWWEWGHRQLGRFIGVVFLIPLVVFAALKWIRPAFGWRMGAIFALGALQAFVGWWMVASGLTGRLDVAPYRLMTHFLMALAIFAAIFWTWLDLREDGRPRPDAPAAGGWALALMCLTALQMAFGALVAGLDAGRSYTDWPLMGGEFLPSAYGAIEPWWRDPFENNASAQFNHRIGGYVLFATAAAAAWYGRRSAARRWLLAIFALCVVQTVIGIVTVLNVAPLPLALTHQGVGVALWLAVVGGYRASVRARQPAGAGRPTKVAASAPSP